MSCLLLSLLESITIKFDCLLLYMMMYFKVAISAGVCMQCQKTCCNTVCSVTICQQDYSLQLKLHWSDLLLICTTNSQHVKLIEFEANGLTNLNPFHGSDYYGID